MQAVVLAGGLGTRLRPLTFSRPKPLLPMVGKPMIQHLLDPLPKEIDEIILTVNYKAEMLERFFSEHEKFQLHSEELHENQVLQLALP